MAKLTTLGTINKMKITLISIVFFFTLHYLYGQSVVLSDLQFKDSIYFKNNIPFSGNIVDYIKNGKHTVKGQLINGRPDSIWFEYNKNGKLLTVFAFQNGQSTYEYHFSNKMAGLLFNGKPTCPYYEFFRTGILKKQGFYLNGNPHGLWKEYYDNGNIKKEITYNNGNIKYPYFEWDKKENKYIVDFYTDEKKAGGVTIETSGVRKKQIN